MKGFCGEIVIPHVSGSKKVIFWSKMVIFGLFQLNFYIIFTFIFYF